MARYWRLVNLLTYSGHLSLSDVQLYDGATKIPTTASATVPPSIGTVALLDDGLSDEAVTWLRCSDPGFAVVLDAGTSYDAVSLRLGSGASAADYPRDVTLQTSADLITWSTYVSYVHATWPGAFALTPTDVAPEAGDPDFSKVVFLLQDNLVDSSALASTVVARGAASMSVANSKFGGKSLAIYGSGDDVVVDSRPEFALPGDFTVEAWVNVSSFSNLATLANIGNYANGALFRIRANMMELFINSSEHSIGVVISVGVWNHVAWSRSGATIRAFLNGMKQGGGFTNSSTIPAGQLRLGASQHNANEYLQGYIDDFRITKGVARYTDDFTPPSTAFLTTSGGGSSYGFAVDTPTPSRLRLPAPAPELYVPAIALTDGSAVGHIREHTFFDVYNGGIGTITGTVKEKNTPANTPLRRRVLLIDEASRMTIRETWSDPVTGAFEFRGIKQGVKYSTISYDHLHNYRAVIADNQDAA